MFQGLLDGSALTCAWVSGPEGKSPPHRRGASREPGAMTRSRREKKTHAHSCWAAAARRGIIGHADWLKIVSSPLAEKPSRQAAARLVVFGRGRRKIGLSFGRRSVSQGHFWVLDPSLGRAFLWRVRRLWEVKLLSLTGK